MKQTMLKFILSLVVVATASFSLAQSVPPERPRNRPPSMLTGRAQWEKGQEMLKNMKVPPAPPLSPEEALQTFRVAPGFRLELVAAEPMVQNPVSFEFDPEGRIWVVEYQGYMRDIKGTGEADPICRVVVLEDTDGDGRADKSTVFLDKLVMPRSLSFVKGGVLIQEPPKIWFCEDTDGDLRSDRRTEVGKLGVAGNPQHTGNGLRYGIDNWLHNADATSRHRWIEGKLIEEPMPHSGQFGVSFDERGRFLTSHESSALHADLIPGHYIVRNRHLAAIAVRGGRGFAGIDTNIARDAQQVYPIRVTPGITLGAMELRDDGRLRTYTIAAGTCFYDGDQFGPEAYGQIFVPESAGNLVGRLKLTSGIRPVASRYYPAEQEFLASTDERFRPVNARVGPDGALYLSDLYRGIIEHVIFMVPWISDQVRDRKLDVGQDQGRIYRLVREDRPIDRRSPQLAAAATPKLVETLNHPTGWWRITAQRLLVERRDPASRPLLAELALRGENPLGRLHALWTLDGFDALDTATKFAALRDPDERVRAAAIRLAERGLDAAQTDHLVAELTRAVEDNSEVMRLQATLTASSLRVPAALPVLAVWPAAGAILCSPQPHSLASRIGNSRFCASSLPTLVVAPRWVNMRPSCFALPRTACFRQPTPPALQASSPHLAPPSSHPLGSRRHCSKRWRLSSAPAAVPGPSPSPLLKSPPPCWLLRAAAIRSCASAPPRSSICFLGPAPALASRSRRVSAGFPRRRLASSSLVARCSPNFAPLATSPMGLVPRVSLPRSLAAIGSMGPRRASHGSSCTASTAPSRSTIRCGILPCPASARAVF